MDSNLYISALQRQPCLLKTNSTRVLVTRLITLVLIICPSSYKARLDNLIGLVKFVVGHIFSAAEQCQTELSDLKCCGRGLVCLVPRLPLFTLLFGIRFWACG